MPVVRFSTFLLLVTALLAGCVEPAVVPAAPGPGEADLAADAAAAGDCMGLSRAVLLGRDGSGRGAIALHSVDPGQVENDLGLPPEVAGSTRCVLTIGRVRGLPPEPRRDLGIESRTSRYVAGNRRHVNPRHRELRQALAAAERNPPAGATRVMSTGVPLVDLVGSAAELLVTGIDRIVRSRRADALREELASAPEEMETPDLQPYRHDVLLIEATRRGSVEVGLAAIEGTVARSLAARVDERRRWRIEASRHPHDPTPLDPDSLPGLEALAAWEAAEPMVRVSTVLAQLVDDVTAAPALPLALPAPAETPAEPSAMPASGAVLRVRGDRGTGLGVRLTDVRAAALDAVIGETGLVQVGESDDPGTYALVRDRRGGSGLVLIDLPVGGPTVVLADPEPGPAYAIVLENGSLTTRAGRLVAADDGALRWWSAGAATIPIGTPVLDRHGDVVGLLGAGPSGPLLPAAALRSVLDATR